MAYDPTLPGIGEATRAWIISQLKSNISNLNTALARDSYTPIGTLTTSCINLGEPDKLPNVIGNGIFFTVVGGGRLDGIDMDQIQQAFFGPVGYSQIIWSSITCYIHPNALLNLSAISQDNARQLVLDRVADWLRADCFNSTAAVAPIIGSREYSVSPNFDQLNMAHIESIEKGMTAKSFSGSQILNYVHCRHNAQICGNG